MKDRVMIGGGQKTAKGKDAPVRLKTDDQPGAAIIKQRQLAR